MTSQLPMSRKEKLRRVSILCCAFLRNLAYYRMGWSEEFKSLLDPVKNNSAEFWKTVNGNFVDACALEWCKLFADRNGKPYWENIVSDPVAFRDELLHSLGLAEEDFRKEMNEMRELRDKHIAHSDWVRMGYVPKLDVAKRAVRFYHQYVAAREAQPGDLAGLPSNIDIGYEECEDEARRVYRQFAPKK